MKSHTEKKGQLFLKVTEQQTRNVVHTAALGVGLGQNLEEFPDQKNTGRFMQVIQTICKAENRNLPVLWEYLPLVRGSARDRPESYFIDL